jgi:hypothetical protein
MPLPKLWKKKINSHTTSESVILPAFCKIVNIIFDEEYGKEILKVPMSGNTISRRIQDTPRGVESHVIANIKEADIFAIHLKE